MANCLIWNARPRNARQHITKNRTTTPFRASSSASILLPTSYSSKSSPLLFRDPEGSASSSLPGAASVSSASAQLPPGSFAFSASAPGSPSARPHLHRQPGTPEPALTSEEIADQILSAAVHRHRPQDPPSLRLQLLHGHAELVPLSQTPRDAHTPRARLNPHWHAKLDPELALRQPGPVNSRMHTLHHLVIAENKLAEDHPTLPLSPPCAHRDPRS